MSLQHARELRKNATDCERLLWLHLRAGRLQGFKFKRQQPLGNYIVDFVCFQTRLIVEADGGQHNEQTEYDTHRDNWLRSQGFNVLRFWNNDILTNTEGVLAVILDDCSQYVGTPSPQPLSREGRGAKVTDDIQSYGADSALTDSMPTANNANFDNRPLKTEKPSSPLPTRERGRRLMSFPRYESYKDSGVDWLGEVPGHWTVTSLKRGFDVRLGKMLQTESSSPDDELLPYLRAANIHWSGIDVSDVKMMWFSSKERVQLTLLPNDLLISEGGDVGRSAMWNSEIDNCHFQNSVNRVRALEGNSNRYLYYWVSVIKDKGYIDVFCNKSTIAHFTAEKVQAVPVPFPSLSEQQTIVAFLDRETAKIDALIAEQQQLIELLKEKRQAVISRAVTKGLNSDAPMKDSGIEWLGEVPAHWEVKRLAFLTAAIQTGPFGSQLHAEDYVDDETPVINPSNIQDGQIVADWSNTVGQDIVEKLNQHKLETGDIIFGRRGEMGRCAKVSNKESGWLCGTDCLNVRLNGLAESDFVSIYLSTAYVRELLKLESVGSTMDNLNTQILSRIPVPVLPLEEQSFIASFLDNETAKLDTLTTEAKTAINLLKERRTALISAAVTGKIDVRGFS